MGGDFNCPLNPIIDKKGGLLNPRKAVISTISNLQEELDLVDIYMEGQKSGEKTLYMASKLAHNLLSFRLLANLKCFTRSS